MTLPAAMLALVALLCFVTTAHAQDAAVAKRYQQSPAVLAHYPDIDIPLATPALVPGRRTYTSQAEMEAFIGALAAAPRSAAHLAQINLGVTPGGRYLPALLLSREGVKTAELLAQLGRPIVWLIGQQHGNEPAGGEAMLALASALADGELTPLLDAVSVVIVPRANPDGAAADTRDNAAGRDINRDHALMSQPEVRLIHRLVRQLPPAIFVDAHEFTVGRRWVETLGGLQSTDLMVLSSTHPMTPAPIRELADTVFQPALEAAIAPHRITSFVYHTISSRSGDRSITVGGNAPGIARNAFGLMGAISFLLETRGVGIGMDSMQRRVATHYIAVKAILQQAARIGAALRDTVALVRTDGATSADDLILGHTVARTATQLPVIDAVSGLNKSVKVDALDTRTVTGAERRARPAGYVVPPEHAEAIRQRLELMGATTCQVTRSLHADMEIYTVVRHSKTDARAINPTGALVVELVSAVDTVIQGSLYVPLGQPAGTRLALSLEPDAPGSLSAELLLANATATTIAIARIPRDRRADAFSAALQCRSADGIPLPPSPRR